MEAVLAQAQRWKSERLLLEVRVGNGSAIRLYQRCGFGEDGLRKGYYPAKIAPQPPHDPAAPIAAGREDALLMSRAL